MGPELPVSGELPDDLKVMLQHVEDSLTVAPGAGDDDALLEALNDLLI